jgi:hypothetical protein
MVAQEKRAGRMECGPPVFFTVTSRLAGRQLSLPGDHFLTIT